MAAALAGPGQRDRRGQRGVGCTGPFRFLRPVRRTDPGDALYARHRLVLQIQGVPHGVQRRQRGLRGMRLRRERICGAGACAGRGLGVAGGAGRLPGPAVFCAEEIRADLPQDAAPAGLWLGDPLPDPDHDQPADALHELRLFPAGPAAGGNRAVRPDCGVCLRILFDVSLLRAGAEGGRGPPGRPDVGPAALCAAKPDGGHPERGGDHAGRAARPAPPVPHHRGAGGTGENPGCAGLYRRRPDPAGGAEACTLVPPSRAGRGVLLLLQPGTAEGRPDRRPYCAGGQAAGG